MPRLPRSLRQSEVVRALVHAGGVESTAKGGHRGIQMPNGRKITVPSGTIKTGTLAAILKQAELTVDEFIELI